MDVGETPGMQIRTGVAGNFGACVCLVWLQARCELRGGQGRRWADPKSPSVAR